MPEKEEVYVDPMNTSFAKIMEIFTLIGLLVMVVFGILYIIGINPYVDMPSVVNNWGLSATKFWEETEGIHVKGYIFLKHLNTMDCLSMIGIAILSLAPLASVIGSLFHSKKKIYVILLLILIAEFIFAIIRPLIMAGGGH